MMRSWLGQAMVPYQSFHPEQHDVDPHLLQRMHSRQRWVFTYTVNQEVDLIRLMDMGVDGVFTDDPPLALQIRQQQRKSPSRSQAKEASLNGE